MKVKKTKKITKRVIDEIQRIKITEGLTPENLLKNGQHKGNPLHNIFEWDNSIAGHKYRLQQARVLINEIKVEIEDIEYYLYENMQVEIEDSGESKREYKDCFEIKDDEGMRKQMITKAVNALTYWRSQYEFYGEEFKGVFREIAKIEKKYNKISAQV